MVHNERGRKARKCNKAELGDGDGFRYHTQKRCLPVNLIIFVPKHGPVDQKDA